MMRSPYSELFLRSRALERRMGSAGIRRGARGGARRSNPDAPILALAPFSWIRADYYSESGGKVTAFLDKVQPGHSLAQGTGALQVATPSVDASMNGQLTAPFTGSQYYDSSLTAATWAFLHDGNGFTVSHTYVTTSVSATRIMLATRDSSGAASDIGIVLYRNTLNQFAMILQRGTTQILSTAAGTVANSTAYCQIVSYREGDATEYFNRLGTTLLASGNSANAPVATAPAGTLRLGGNVVGGGLDSSRWAETIVWNRVLSAGELATLAAYRLARFGLS